VAAYSHHLTALSLASEDFSWQQPAPPDCCILDLVESSLLVIDFLFVRENPAYFAYLEAVPIFATRSDLVFT